VNIIKTRYTCPSGEKKWKFRRHDVQEKAGNAFIAALLRGDMHDMFIGTGIPADDGGTARAGSISDREDVETWDVYLLKTGLP
jgi:hypothetical protein